MKVALDGNRLVRIGKDLAPETVDAESIGMILFRQEGPARFRRAVENALRDSSACNQWYLSVINELAKSSPVWTCAINGLRWCEVDFPVDLKQARNVAMACNDVGWSSGAAKSRYAWG
jgi:choline kinase